MKKKFPELTSTDVSHLRNHYLGTIGSYIEEGFQPAVVKPNPDGSMDVVVLTFERLKKTQEEGRQGKTNVNIS